MEYVVPAHTAGYGDCKLQNRHKTVLLCSWPLLLVTTASSNVASVMLIWRLLVIWKHLCELLTKHGCQIDISTLMSVIFGPHCLHAVHRCGLFLQLPHVALCIGRTAVWGIDLHWPVEPCIRLFGPDSPWMGKILGFSSQVKCIGTLMHYRRDCSLWVSRFKFLPPPCKLIRPMQPVLQPVSRLQCVQSQYSSDS